MQWSDGIVSLCWSFQKGLRGATDRCGLLLDTKLALDLVRHHSSNQNPNLFWRDSHSAENALHRD